MRESDRQIAGLERHVAGGADSVYGHQWGDPARPPLRAVVDEWIAPATAAGETIVEIGVGGGRWVPWYAARMSRCILVDGTPAAEEAVRRHCTGPLEFMMSADGLLPIADASVDYVFSFDTFVHFDLDLFDAYIRTCGRILKDAAVLHLHYATWWPEC